MVYYVPEEMSKRKQESFMLGFLFCAFFAICIIFSLDQTYGKKIDELRTQEDLEVVRMINFLVVPEDHAYMEPGVFVVRDVQDFRIVCQTMQREYAEISNDTTRIDELTNIVLCTEN